MSEQINIDELERLANAATKSPWKASFTQISNVETMDGALIARCNKLNSLTQLQANAHYIAAANPATVLTLISQLRALGDRAMHLERRLSEANGEVLRLQGADEHALKLQAGHDEAVMRAHALEQERDALAARLEVIPGGGPDGIECRDATIKLQDARIADLEARLKALEGQEPVAYIDNGTGRPHWYPGALPNNLPHGTKLFARPVPAEPVNARLLGAIKRLSFCAQTTGGTAGRDEELCAAIGEAEKAISDAESAPKAVRLTDEEINVAYFDAMKQHVRPQDANEVRRVVRRAETAVLRKNGIEVAE